VRAAAGARGRDARQSRQSRALILKSALLRAAAALLIQGSTCVYSRKVEYLHKLVYNALEAVASKRRARPLSLSSPARWPAARCC
jgi:hypothetical protein